MLRCWWRKRIKSVLPTPENRKPAAPFVCCPFRAALHRNNPCTMTSSSALSFFLFWGNFYGVHFNFTRNNPIDIQYLFRKGAVLVLCNKNSWQFATRWSKSPAVISRRTRAIRTSNSLQSYFFKLFHVPLSMCHNSLPGHGCLPCSPAADTHLC